MPTWRPGRRRAAITASATRERPEQTVGTKTRHADWQERAMAAYDQVGPVWYAAQFYAKPLSAVELVVRVRDEDGDLAEPTPEQSALLERISGKAGSGRSLLQAQYGRLRFLNGECYLLVTADAAGREVWECVSVFEVTLRDGKITRKTGKAEETYVDVSTDPPAKIGPDQAVVYRLWAPHPRYSALADAPLRAVLDDCEEFRLLSLAVRSRATSRAAGAGLLLYPDETSIALPLSDQPDDDPDADPFMRVLTDALLAPIAEPGAPGGVVPITIRAPGETIEQWRHIDLRPAAAYEEKDLRDEALRRIATGLDMPPEVLLGTADVNHWGSWLISEKEWKTHVEPVCRALCEELTTIYLRPAAEAAGLADAENLIVWYDETAAVMPPDRTEDAKDAYDRYAISADALRRVGGFDEEDAPTDDEVVRRIAIETGDSTLLLTGEAAPAAAPPAQPPAAPQEPPDGPADGGEVDQAPPAPAETAMMARLAGAADLIVDRARALAGSRALSRGAKVWRTDRPAYLSAATVRDACAAIRAAGEWDARTFGEPDMLVAGAGREAEERIVAWGVEPTTARLLVAAAERFAADTLLEERPGALPAEVIGLCLQGGALVSP